MRVRFTWDPLKNQANIKKHGVSFEEASSIFLNFPLEVFHDPDHSDQESRYIAVGFSDRARMLLVVHCENHSGTLIRIISARKPANREAKQLFGPPKGGRSRR